MNTKTTHTPTDAPWRVVNRKNHLGMQAIVTKGGLTLANFTLAATDEDKAAMAAAHELLAALKDLADSAAHNLEQTGYPHDQAMLTLAHIDAARAAIAKATGGQS